MDDHQHTNTADAVPSSYHGHPDPPSSIVQSPDIQTPGHASPTMTPPSEFMTSPSSHTHVRSTTLPYSPRLSQGPLPRGGPRLSLSFPVQTNSVPPSIQSSPVLAPPSVSSASTSPDPEKKPTVPLDSGSFLTALAAQERRVLELREELHRAENDLDKLKRQWAVHEANKKRNEIRHVHQLRPLNTTVGDLQTTSSETDVSSSLIKEQERKRAILSAQRNPQRKVFAGSRHTRTLSLLSPGAGNPKRSSLQSELLRGHREVAYNSPRDGQISDESNLRKGKNEYSPSMRHSYQGPNREAILRTGRQMATDFREGLWTFIEDLRQATVGEEGVNATTSRTSTTTTPTPIARRQGSKNSLHESATSLPSSRHPGLRAGSRQREQKEDGHDALIDVGGTFWKDFGVATTNESGLDSQHESGFSRKKEPKSQPNHNDDAEDEWEAWESPKAKSGSPRWSRSTMGTEDWTSPPLSEQSSRTSTSASQAEATTGTETNKGSRDEIPWPSFNNFNPGNLKKTATTLLSEWERSLSPVSSAQSHGSSASRSASRSLSPTKNTKSE